MSTHMSTHYSYRNLILMEMSFPTVALEGAQMLSASSNLNALLVEQKGLYHIVAARRIL